MDFAFHFYNSMAETGILMALRRILGDCDAPPVVLCVGSDLAVGDSLGPIAGTMLKKHAAFGGFLYGTLKTPVTAKEIGHIGEFLRQTHPGSKVIAVDAAVGEEADVGLIKVLSGPLKPGSGANKQLGRVGDASILGIVAPKSAFSYSLLNLTRLNVVYTMAEQISSALAAFCERDELRSCS